MNINIIFEDKNIIVVEKKQGIPSQSDKTGDLNMVSILNDYFNNKDENSEAVTVHRLDRPVGGIMVFAKNKISGGLLSKQIQDGTFKKTYTAVVCGKPERGKLLADYIIKNQRLNLSKIVNKNIKGAKRAELKYEIVESAETKEYGVLSLLKIFLFTGRHHQIRVQLANDGIPIWGDTKYNNSFKKRSGFFYTALMAASIEFNNPSNNKRILFELNPPNEFPFNLFKKIPNN